MNILVMDAVDVGVLEQNHISQGRPLQIATEMLMLSVTSMDVLLDIGLGGACLILCPTTPCEDGRTPKQHMYVWNGFVSF